MSILVECDSERSHEQINDSVEYIFNGIKSILENDEFGIFELRASKRTDDEIERTDEQIQKMIVASQERNDKNTKLSNLVQQLKSANQTKAETLIKRIGIDAN